MKKGYAKGGPAFKPCAACPSPAKCAKGGMCMAKKMKNGGMVAKEMKRK